MKRIVALIIKKNIIGKVLFFFATIFFILGLMALYIQAIEENLAIGVAKNHFVLAIAIIGCTILISSILYNEFRRNFAVAGEDLLAICALTATAIGYYEFDDITNNRTVIYNQCLYFMVPYFIVFMLKLVYSKKNGLTFPWKKLKR